MRDIIKLFVVLLFALPSATLAHNEGGPVFASLPESRNQIIKLSDSGLFPVNLTMKLEDSIVFLLNSTSESLVTVEIDFGGKITHCATKNLKIEKNMKLHSERPYGPGDFASFCFHEKGSYPYVIYGSPASPEGLRGAIIVE